MITLVKLSDQDYPAFKEQTIQNYAEQSVRAGRIAESEALAFSKRTVGKVLPRGLKTEGHTIFSIIEASEKEPVGYLWVGSHSEHPRQAFIYDLFIKESYRGNGYGREAIRQLKTRLAEMGYESVGLHVYAFNEVAIKLYSKEGFETISIIMKCPLKEDKGRDC